MVTELEKLQEGADKYAYNTETGVFTFKKSPLKALIGREAGTWKADKSKKHTNYYKILSVRFNGKEKSLKAHRLAWFIVYGEVPDEIDHIEHARREDDSLNRIKNLRNGTTRDNQSNRTDGSSKYTGVSWHKNSNKWKAQINIDGKHVHLGYFITEKEASEAYQKRLAEINN